MRRLLVISSSFPPAGGAAVLRLLKTIKYLPEFGWETTVLTTDAPTDIHFDPTLGASVSERVEVIRLPSPLARFKRRGGAGGAPTLRGRLRRRLIHELLIPDAEMPWALAAARVARRELARARFAAVFTTSPLASNHVAARLALGELAGRRVPWLADLRDPWVQKDGTLGVARSVWAVDRMLERICLGSVDGFATVNPPILELYERRYPALQKRPRAVIPNGFDPDDYSAAPAALPSELADLGTRFDLVYTGRFYESRSPGNGLLAALGELGRRDPAFARDARIFLLGPIDPLAEPELAPAAPVAVVRLPALPYAQSVSAQRRAAALVLLGGGGDVHFGARPLKSFEYLAARRPILAHIARGSALEDLLRGREGVATVAIEDGKEALVAALAALHAAWTRERSLPSLAWDASLDRFSRRTLTGELATLLDRLVDERR